MRYTQLYFFCIVLGILPMMGHSQLSPIDPTFSQDGYQLYAPGASTRQFWNSAVQADGKIVATGYYSSPNSSVYPITMRVHPDGTPDSTFSGDGVLIDSLSGYQAWMHSVLIQPHDRIVIGGFGRHCEPGSACISVFTLIGYLPDGRRDSTFGIDGAIQIFPFVGGGACYKIMSLPNGQIIAIGHFYPLGGESDVMVARYDANGLPDSTFGTNGATLFQVSAHHDWVKSFDLQPDGKMVVAGTAYDGTERDAFISRVNADGSLDTTFGGGTGSILLSIPGTKEELSAICVLPNGKIFATGTQDNWGPFQQFDMQVLPNGSLDTSFHTIGYRSSQLLPNGFATRPNGCFAQPNGKVMISGSFSTGISVHGMMQRLDASGNLDPTFGGAGFDTLSNGSEWVYFNGLSLQADGRMVTVGYDRAGGSNWYSCLIARYLNADLMAGLEDVESENPLLAYPNPAHNSVTVRFVTPMEGHLTLTDISGRILQEKAVSGVELMVDLRRYASGMYWLIFEDGDGAISSRKIMVGASGE